jgi:hypothetical protein
MKARRVTGSSLIRFPIASALDGAAVSKSVDTGVLATSTLTNMMGAASISEEVGKPKEEYRLSILVSSA